jgi:hypothetical protein
MLCEGTKFSHTYIRVRSDSLSRDLIYQATGTGVYFIGSIGFDEEHEVVEEFDLGGTEEIKKVILQWAIDMSGRPYSHKQFLGIGIKRLFKLFGRNIKNPFSDGNKGYICTELVAEAAKFLGEELKDVDSIGLQEVYDHVVKLAKLASAPNS